VYKSAIVGAGAEKEEGRRVWGIAENRYDHARPDFSKPKKVRN
jgi:hypothetical protein